MTEYFTLEQAREVASIPETLGALIGIPYEQWGKRCHEISGKLLDTGRFGPGRIARGWAQGLVHQHSLIVLSRDVYDPQAVIVDPTIWHWRDQPEKGILTGIAGQLDHFRAHGAGSIWAGPRPEEPSPEEIIELTPSFELSEEALLFLSEDILGPLGRRGWGQLANGRMQDWPAAEIIAAMDDTPALRALVPVDILGMLTDRDPARVYLQHLERGESHAEDTRAQA